MAGAPVTLTFETLGWQYWTVPANCYAINWVWSVAAGAYGTAGVNGNPSGFIGGGSGGSGGGSGGAALSENQAVTPGEVFQVYVGGSGASGGVSGLYEPNLGAWYCLAYGASGASPGYPAAYNAGAYNGIGGGGGAGPGGGSTGGTGGTGGGSVGFTSGGNGPGGGGGGINQNGGGGGAASNWGAGGGGGGGAGGIYGAGTGTTYGGPGGPGFQGIVQLNYTPQYKPVISSVSPASGSLGGGYTVQIYGSNFSNGTLYVAFGSAYASSFSVISDNQISVVVPPQTSIGTVNVAIYNADGWSIASSADYFTYTVTVWQDAAGFRPGPTLIGAVGTLKQDTAAFSNTAALIPLLSGPQQFLVTPQWTSSVPLGIGTIIQQRALQVGFTVDSSTIAPGLYSAVTLLGGMFNPRVTLSPPELGDITTMLALLNPNAVITPFLSQTYIIQHFASMAPQGVVPPPVGAIPRSIESGYINENILGSEVFPAQFIGAPLNPFTVISADTEWIQLQWDNYGAQVLYGSASGLEKAMADADAPRLLQIDAEAIIDSWNPLTCPLAMLPYLAWAMGVTFWNDKWSEETKRAWIASQWQFKALRGTNDGINMAVDFAGRDVSPFGYSVRRIITQPQGQYPSPGITHAAQEAWLASLPQVRVYFFTKTGTALADEFFINWSWLGTGVIPYTGVTHYTFAATNPSAAFSLLENLISLSSNHLVAAIQSATNFSVITPSQNRAAYSALVPNTLLTASLNQRMLAKATTAAASSNFLISALVYQTSIVLAPSASLTVTEHELLQARASFDLSSLQLINSVMASMSTFTGSLTVARGFTATLVSSSAVSSMTAAQLDVTNARLITEAFYGGVINQLLASRGAPFTAGQTFGADSQLLSKSIIAGLSSVSLLAASAFIPPFLIYASPAPAANMNAAVTQIMLINTAFFPGQPRQVTINAGLNVTSAASSDLTDVPYSGFYPYIYCTVIPSVNLSAYSASITVLEKILGNLSVTSQLSADITLMAWTPLNLGAALIAWHDASDINTVTLGGSNVSNIADKSGNGRDLSISNSVTYSTGSLNGRNAASFDSVVAGYLATSSFSFSQPCTIFTIFQTGASLRTYASVWDCNDNSAPVSRGILFATRPDTSGEPCLYAGTNLEAVSGASLAFNTSYLSVATLNDVNSSHGFNGNTPTVLAGTPGTGGITNGFRWSGGGDPFTGLIGSTVIVDGLMATADRQKVEGFLMWQFGLQNLLPPSHPYYAQRPLASNLTPPTSLATITLGNFNILSGEDGRIDYNADSSIGWLGWGACILEDTFYFPYTGEYSFTVPSYWVVDTRPFLGNSIQIYIDQIAAAAVGAGPGNEYVHFVQNSSPSLPYTFKAYVFKGTHAIMFRCNYAAYSSEPTNQVHSDSVIIATTGVPYPLEPSGTRDPSLYPLSSNSHWNLPITDAAQWSTLLDADTQQLLTTVGLINAGQWSIPVYLGQNTDPVSTIEIIDSGVTPDISIPGPIYSIHAPSGLTVAPPFSGGDNNIAVIDTTNKRYVFAGFGASVSGTTIQIGRGKRFDNYNGSNYAMDQAEGEYFGLIRSQDISNGSINHQLVFGLATQLVRAGTSVVSGLAWPAAESDYNGPFGLYTGNVLYGSKIGIPVGTTMPTLTTGGKMLWNCLMNYGAIMNVTGGEPNPNLTFYAEQALEGNSTLADMRTDAFTTIIPYLRIMRNHNRFTPNGGGNPLVPLLPGLMRNLPTGVPVLQQGAVTVSPAASLHANATVTGP